MAGTVTCGTISDGTNSTSSTNCIQGSAKAWVNFNGSTGVRNGSYNVSSVTRNTTGDYTIAFTNALADGNYSVTGMTQDGTNGYILQVYAGSSTTASSVRVRSVNPNVAVVDATTGYVAVFR